MDAELKERWVTALRSGEYEQTGGALRSSLGWCCLGVLCDLDERVTWEDGHAQFLGQLDECELPEDYREEIGMSIGTMQTLIEKNDSGLTFTDIADYIERSL